MDHSLKDKTVCIAGLGYVGLPLALAFSRHLKTIGFDVDAGKIRELFQANDNPGIAFTTSTLSTCFLAFNTTVPIAASSLKHGIAANIFIFSPLFRGLVTASPTIKYPTI